MPTTPGTPSRAACTSSTTLALVESTVSSVGMTPTSAESPIRHCGVSGAKAAATPSTFAARVAASSAEPAESFPSISTSIGDTMPPGTPPSCSRWSCS